MDVESIQKVRLLVNLKVPGRVWGMGDYKAPFPPDLYDEIKSSPHFFQVLEKKDSGREDVASGGTGELPSTRTTQIGPESVSEDTNGPSSKKPVLKLRGQ